MEANPFGSSGVGMPAVISPGVTAHVQLPEPVFQPTVATTVVETKSDTERITALEEKVKELEARMKRRLGDYA